jgi:hypothetical protein
VILDCSHLKEIARSLPLVVGCDVVRNGALRMSTPFMYPNGDHIDVFLEAKTDSLFMPLSLSDYGQTSLYLRGAQIEMNASSRKREIVSLILAQLNVKQRNGDLFVEIADSNPTDITDAIFRLSQACLRISDFASHQRLRSANPFRDDVEDFIQASGIRYNVDVKVPGRFRNEVRVDFEVFGREHKSYVCVLATAVESTAHVSATETFRKWYDIASAHESEHQLVTVFNSRSSFLKDADRQRLGEFSKLVPYPAELETLRELIAA